LGRRCLEAWEEGSADGVHEAVLELRGELLGAVVVPEGGLGLVAALGEDAAGGDVAGDVVGVGGDPEASAVELALEAEGVVHDDLAAEEHHGEVGGEGPGLDGVGEGGRRGFSAFDAFEPTTGVVADDARGGGAFLPLVAGEVGLEGDGDGFEGGVRGGGEGLQGEAKEASDLGGEGAAVAFDELDGAARVGVGVGATADGDEGDGCGLGGFEVEGGDAGPVAVGGVEVAAEGGAMAGVVGEDGAEGTVGRGDAEDGQVVVHGAAGGSAVLGEADAALAP